MATTIFLVNPVNFGGGSSFTNEKSLLFDGVDEYVNCGNVTTFNSNNKFSVSFWFKHTANVTDRIFEGKDVSSNDRFIIYYSSSAGGRLYTQIRNGGTNDVYIGHTYNSNWNHLVVTYDGAEALSGNRVRIYMNGTNPTQSSSGTQPTSLSANTGTCAIGASTNPFTGNIDEVGVFDYTLTSGQVTSLYNSGTPTDLDNTSGVTAPVHWWRMGDGDTFPTINDVGTTGGNNGTMTNMESGDIVTDVP